LFIYFRSYAARLGPIDSQHRYLCAHCGADCGALVRTQALAYSLAIFGIGGSQRIANRRAQAMVERQTRDALESSGCPSCGRLQSSVLEKFAAVERATARRRRLGVPLALGLAAVFGMVGLVPAIHDLAHSSALLFLSLGAALTAGSIALGVALRGAKAPVEKVGSVWFWWSESAQPGYRDSSAIEWQPAPRPDLPPIAQPSRAGRVLGVVGAVCGGLLALGSLVVWSASFSRLYVVNGAEEPLIVSVDGEDRGSVGVADARPGKDVTYGAFTMRTDRSHQLVLRSGAGIVGTYTLDPATATGWVVAPHAAADDLCIVAEEVVYGGAAGPAEDPRVLNASNDLVVLRRGYDDVFQHAPETMAAQSGETPHRWTLRALRCSSLKGSTASRRHAPR
jgi:hypothetical protein